MRKSVVIVLMFGLFLTLGLTGCGPKKAESSQSAIEAVEAIEGTAAKVEYLVSQAKDFYSSQEFQQAIDVAQHILRYLDKDSEAAKSILEQAKEALKQKASQAVSDVKGKIADFGK